MSQDIEQKEFHPGEYIFFEDDLDKNFYMIDEGLIEIFTKDPDGKRVSLAQLGPGDCFGEMALLVNAPRTASAQALRFSKVLVISDEKYKELLAELPEWAQGLIRTLSQRLLAQNQKIKQLSSELRHLKEKT